MTSIIYKKKNGDVMHYFYINAVAVTASFRIPESHTFQQTLPLPPITTLIGIVGAAVGLDYEQAMQYRQKKGLLIGVTGTHKGKMNDLWKYRKIKSREVISAVLLKEILVDLELTIVIGCEDKATLSELRKSFIKPRYALTAGTSDDLLKIIKVGQLEKTNTILLSDFENTILPGDFSDRYNSNIDLEKIPLTKTIYAPAVHLLPTDFIFKGSERRAVCRKHFTFVDTPIKLKKPLPGLMVDEKAVVLM